MILIVSSDKSIIGALENLCHSIKIKAVVCESMERFFSVCYHQNFKVGIIDLAIFSDHKLRFSVILKDSLSEMKIITIGSVNDLNEKELVGSNISQKIIYRLVKPFSIDEVRSVVDALM